MRARNREQPMNGWLVVDKPAGITSAAVVAKVRRATGGAKAGHAGTLDPLATGVLPIALGAATKTMAYATDSRKRYRFEVRWGEQRDTDDAEGSVIADSPVRPSVEAIQAILSEFRGEIEQVPPRFSAIKVGGRRAYAMARAQEDVDLPARLAVIEAIDLVDVIDIDTALFEVTSGKGVYMRALARDMAIRLGTVGYIANLRRLSVGPFDETMATPLEVIDAKEHIEEIEELLLPVGAVLADIPALALTEPEARRLKQGRPLAALPIAKRSSLKGISPESVVCAVSDGKVVALAQVKGGEIRPVRVLT